MIDIIFSTAATLATTIRQKEITSLEVLEAHLEHIAKYNPKLNAIVTLYEENARMRAKQADDALARGEVWGPLHGVPVTLKNLHSIAGMISPWAGHPDYANRIPTEDSAMAAKLRQAGAVIMGLTNSHILGNNIFGQTKNPWNVDRTPGFSSAGSATAVAAGLSPIDIGNDSLASILRPASLCGVFGMRPTEHRVSNAGGRVLGAPHSWQLLTVSGPLTRSVEDLALTLKVIAGPDGRDIDVPPIPWREVTDVKLQGLRIAWSHTFPQMPLAKDIHNAVEGLVVELNSAGARIVQAMPELDYVKAHALAWQFIAFTWEDLYRSSGWIAQDVPPFRLDDLSRMVSQREELVQIWEQFFTQWDVFLCPVGMHTAGLHTDIEPVIDGKVYLSEEVSPSTESISPLTGLPSITLPIGLDTQGLPIGIQLIGRRWEDERLLAIAKIFSQITGDFRRPTGY